MNHTKPIASLSLDLDNQWSYLKTHGDPRWESLPSYLPVLVPRVLRFLKERDLKITFFIVGQDAALPENQEVLARIAAEGHEIGNHSFHHKPWLHLYSQEEVETELARAEESIENATGQKPIGFRGPGYSFSRTTLEVLGRRGYLYDASSLPTFLGPLARLYYFMTTKLSENDKWQRKALFGKLSDGLRPVRPYRWQIDGGGLIEIPVTTMPVFKLPFHLSYILYFSGYSKSLAVSYFKTAVGLCLRTQTPPSLLLHPLDFLGCDDTRDLDFFPGMRLPSTKKIELVGELLDLVSGRFVVKTLCEHAQIIGRVPDLRLVDLKFAPPNQGTGRPGRGGDQLSTREVPNG